MKAYVVDNDQSAGVRFADVPDPNPAPNEALIGVEAFSVNHGELPGAGVFGNSWTPLLPWETNGADLGYLVGLVAAGALDPHITWRGSWKQLPDAITLLQNRTISGKAVLRVG